MNILGLGKHQKPFIYLDEYIQGVDWEKLHTEVCYGISQSAWDKRFVASGVHDAFVDQEITPYLKEVEFQNKHLSDYERTFYNKLKTYDEKIKFANALKYIPHPFWVIFIRNNKRVEGSGVFNKANADDCYWTDNSRHFPTLLNLIERMPFAKIGRVILFMTEANNKTLPHFDSREQNDRPNDDFIWFTTKPETKNIYVMDKDTQERVYADSDKKFVWFNEMDFHGTDPVKHFSFSIRIDGVFTQELKDAILN